MIVDDERELQDFEDRLYFLEEAERLEFMRAENVQVVDNFDNETTALAQDLQPQLITCQLFKMSKNTML